MAVGEEGQYFRRALTFAYHNLISSPEIFARKSWKIFHEKNMLQSEISKCQFLADVEPEPKPKREQ